MQKFTFILLLSIQLLQIGNAQITADFEDLLTAVDTFDNGDGAIDFFASGNARFPVFYNAQFESWSGWAISSKTDVISQGFTNQYSAITGSGFEDSNTYAVAFVTSVNRIIHQDVALGEIIEGMYVTNGTYPYFSMLNGDGFAKKFGGATGDDPDFFKLTIKKYLDGQLSTDSVDFFLADYRFTDNSQDYIIDEWTYIDLSVLGPVDSLELTLSSTDNGNYGMNTPAYFCIDNFISAGGTSSAQAPKKDLAFSVYPNPTGDYVEIATTNEEASLLHLYNSSGTLLRRLDLNSPITRLDLSALPKGNYFLHLSDGNSFGVRKITKL